MRPTTLLSSDSLIFRGAIDQFGKRVGRVFPRSRVFMVGA